MHHLMLVTLSVEDGTSDKARHSAYSQLLEDKSFCGDGGRFSSPLCDWFVIGGRWSGLLSETLLGDPYKYALKHEFPNFPNDDYPAHLQKLQQAGLDKLWHRFGGTGPNPLTRSSDNEYGHDDDAMLVNRALFDRFLKPVAGHDRNIEGDRVGLFVDLDVEDVDESFIGRKWLVVVDYHN